VGLINRKAGTFWRVVISGKIEVCDQVEITKRAHENPGVKNPGASLGENQGETNMGGEGVRVRRQREGNDAKKNIRGIENLGPSRAEASVLESDGERKNDNC